MSNPFKGITLPVNYNECSQNMRRLVREQYMREQGNLCKHCKHPLDGRPASYIDSTRINSKLFPRGFFNNPVHLHHDHTTGMTIGAVHARCNAYLWQYIGK